MPEPDAFRWIQRAAMDHRLSMRAVAERVIAEAEQKEAQGSE
jgi:response regulator NasT